MSQVPDFESDPIGFLEYQNRVLQGQVNQLGALRARDTLHGFVSQAEQARLQRDPLYSARASHVRRQVQAFHELLTGDPQQAAVMTQNSLEGLAASLAQRGEDPAEAAARLSDKLGFRLEDAAGEVDKWSEREVDSGLDLMRRADKIAELDEKHGYGAIDDAKYAELAAEVNVEG